MVIKNPITSPLSRPENDGSDLLKFRNLPSLSVEDAAWVAGITPEALHGFLAAAGIKVATGGDGVTRISLNDLLRGGFSLVSRKETQVTMLRTQLHGALEREKGLAAALQMQLGKPAHGWEESESAEVITPAPAPVTEVTPQGGKAERTRKTRKR